MGKSEEAALGWTYTTKLWVGGQGNMANALSMLRECFANILDFFKRNWPSAARIQFTKLNNDFYNGAKPKILKLTFWAKKNNQYSFRVYQMMRNSNIWEKIVIFYF